MKTKITRLLLTAVLMMCCTVGASAQLAFRSGEVVTNIINDAFDFVLYRNYSYTYVYSDKTITKECSGNCAVLTSINIKQQIPSSITYNGEEYTVVALDAHLNGITNLEIPNSLEVIECNSFNGDVTHLANLTIADGDKDLYCFPILDGLSVSGGTFSKVNTLKKLYLGRNLRYPGEGDNTQGTLAPFANGTFAGVEVTVGPNVTRIPDYCFFQQYSIMGGITNGIKTLNLTNATSLQSIGQCAFAVNTTLTSLDFSYATSLQSIGEAAFMHCTSLATINFGDIPLYIDKLAFGSCTNLSKAFFFSNTPPTLREGCLPENGTVYVKNSKLVAEYSKVYDFKGRIIAHPDNMTLTYRTIDGKVLPYPTYSTNGEINARPSEILHQSYKADYGIMYFDHIPTSIGEHWFEFCGSLFSISLPSTITSIGEGAFNDCVNLRTIVIPKSVNYIGKQAFKGCSTLSEVFFWGNDDIELKEGIFENTPATIYVADMTNFPGSWGGKTVKSWRSGKGDGTRERPFEIGNYLNLFGFSLDVLSGNTSICGKLTADITANENVLNDDGSLRPGLFKIWEPIGSWEDNYAKGYRGEFDGGGHTISGLYFNDETRSAVGLFGMTNGSTTDFSPTSTDRARIHDVGIKDSYFRGKSHVGGICGDFASGWMQNCWNAATVHAIDGTVGGIVGIVGSVWKYAHITGCYNIGYVSVDSDNKNTCGGICGVVSRSNVGGGGVTAEDCVSLEGRCDKAWNADYTDVGSGQALNVTVKNAVAFASGEVCWILNGDERKYHGSLTGTNWRQQIGKDPLPIWTGNYLVNYWSSDSEFYYNVTMCDKAENHNHVFGDHYVVERCDGSIFKYWQCRECGKYFAYEGREGRENQAKELSKNECSTHFLEFVNAAVMPTTTTAGHYDYWHCTHCGKDFLEGDYSNPVTSEQLTVPVHSKNNEIWYTSTQNQKITPYNPNSFGATIQTNEYIHGLGKITFDNDVTLIGLDAFKASDDSYYNICANLQSISIPSSVEDIKGSAFKHCRSLQKIDIPSKVRTIGEYAFSNCSSLQSVNIPSNSNLAQIQEFAFVKCSSLQSINIPSHVLSIGQYAFGECNSLQSVTFHSIPNIGQHAFSSWDPLNIENKILDFTDSDKPYIGTSFDNYPVGGFTEARYHRTLEKNKLETIVLPFTPTAESIAGLKFYVCNTVFGKMVSILETEDIEAGVPYLVKNMSDSKTEYTLVAATPKDIVLNTSSKSFDEFTMKGTFKSQSLKNTGSKKFYYLDDNMFKVASSSRSIDQFRAYLETENMEAVESLTIPNVIIKLAGDGTSDNPYQIGNRNELEMYAQIINLDNSGACGILTSDIIYNKGVLDADGKLNSGKMFDVWTPMGGHGKDFSGEFNGNGHTISGLYFNDGSVNNVGLFGKAVGSANIHDLGIEDSYFCGNSWVAGICGDFASGTIENCWNGATVISNDNNSCAGGIAGSCWVNASVTDCYNKGKISAGSGTNILCGGICGSVAKNNNAAIYSVSNCVSLEGKCNKAYNLYNDAKIDNVDIKNAAAFASGEVCWLLNGGSSENVAWHQTLGESGDQYPTLTGEDIVYLTARKCDGSTKAFSNSKPESVSQDEHILVMKDGKAHCEGCEQDFVHYLAQDDKPVLLDSENDRYSLDKVKLLYGHSYLCTDEVNVDDFSYTFAYHPNVWNSWFVPFEITTGELGDMGFTAAYIAGVRQYEKDAEGNVITQVDVIKIKNGYLFAGTPYLIKQESDATQALTTEFQKTGATLKTSSDVHPLNSATTTASYDFIGTYNTIANEDVKADYILGKKGTFAHPSGPVYALNWYMKIEEKERPVYGQPVYAKSIVIRVIGEEDQTTGIRTLYPAEKQATEVYDLSGRRLNAPKKGQINIINGKKILVK